jgi:RAQPRD family integrative conjugative element protein
LIESVGSSHAALNAALGAAGAKRDRLSAALKDKRDTEVRAAKEKYGPIITGARQEREQGLRDLASKYSRRTSEIERGRDAARGTAEAERRGSLEEAQRTLDAAKSAAESAHARATGTASTRYETDWSAMERDWKTGMLAAYAAADRLISESERVLPEWDSDEWKAWSPPRVGAPAVRFGRLHIDLAAFGVAQRREAHRPGAGGD